tara:strand:- start:77 stop:346 length:270 start_codon:yes stop_codon:yes gene_type:complete
MTISHIEKLTKFDEEKPMGDHLTIKRWMTLYNLEQEEVADTFGITQPAVSKMLQAEELGKRIFYIIEEPEDFWNLIEVKKRHSGKFPWL